MIGTTLAHYRILESIGVGGMGEVFRARDTRLDREVALKILPSESAKLPELRQRFEVEAKAIAALKHPNIVTLHSIEEAAGTHFLTMELVEGQTLAELLPAGGFPPDEFLTLAIPLTSAVAAAHAKNITHRDLKPANIMVSSHDCVKVLDFGLAKFLFDPSEDLQTTTTKAQLTQTGLPVGTVAYMSPEQISGSSVDRRSDIFSLGIIFYELLSGERPFHGSSPPAVMYQIVHDQPPPLTHLPAKLWAVVQQSLQKNPEDRFCDADSLGEALRALEDPTTGLKSNIPPCEARAAYKRGDWETAYRQLQDTRSTRELTAEEFELLAAAGTWVGEVDESIRSLESACAKYTKAGNHPATARTALYLIHYYENKNSPTIAGAWLKRAERFLQDSPECVEHGYLLRRQVVIALRESDHEAALALNQQCAEIAERFDDPDLITTALHDRGQILVAQGQVKEGNALVDEAMASAMSGEVSQLTVGNLFCRTMALCDSLADYGRAREWTKLAWKWCEPHGSSPYRGICRIHSAETMRHHGRWAEAEEAVRDACISFEKQDNPSHTGEAFNELGQIELRKGNFQEAEIAFGKAHEFGHDPVPGVPLLRLAQGKGSAGFQMLERALNEAVKHPLSRAKLLVEHITIAIATGKLDVAENSALELADISKTFACPAFSAHALMGQGAIAIERGQPEDAAPILRQAWSTFKDLELLYDAARVRVLLGKAYLASGNEGDAELELQAAHKTFQDLGAKPDLEIVKKLRVVGS